MKLILNHKQRNIINQWFGTSRYVYNRALHYINNPHSILPDGDISNYEINLSYLTNPIINFFSLRDLFVTKLGNDHLNEWEFDTPKDIRAGILKTLVTSYKSIFTKIKKGDLYNFKMNYKTKKDTTRNITIPKTAIKKKNNKLYIFNTYIKSPIKTKQKIKNMDIECDSQLHYDGLNYYLLIPIKTKVKTTEDQEKIIALDPGVKRFQTGFSNTECIEVSSRTDLLDKLKNKIALLQSLNKKMTSHVKRQIKRYYRKISNIVDDIHWKTINYLTTNYNDILLPSFESQGMIEKMNINQGKTKYEMLRLKHYTFKVRLINKAKSIKNVRIHIVNEAYTSKTCTRCGTLNKPLPNHVVCDKCKIIIERDINGSRNILLKHLL